MMSGFWSDEAQERAYGMLLDGEIRLSNNVDKFQLLRSVASWSEDDCFDFVDAYPRQQQELLRAELPGPSTESEDPRSLFQKAKFRNPLAGTGRDPYKLSGTPKLVMPEPRLTRRIKHDPTGKYKGFGKGRTCSSLEFARCTYISDRDRDDAELEAIKQSRPVQPERFTLF